MGISCGGRLRRLALVMSLGVLAALAIAGATSARVDNDVSGSPSVSLLEAKPDFVTFCHVAGRAEDPANTVTLTLPSNAVFGQGVTSTRTVRRKQDTNTIIWERVRRRRLRRTCVRTSTATRQRSRKAW